MSRQKHLSRMAAPSAWPVKRKGRKWIAKPRPGPHSLQTSIPLLIIIRDLLKLARTSREVKAIMHSHDVLLNKRPVRDVNIGVGIFDTLSLPKLNICYRLVLAKNSKLRLVEIAEKEAALVPLKVTGKTSLKGGKSQLNFNNGWNVLSKDEFKIGDSVLFNALDGKFEQKLPLESGAAVYVTGGKHSGMVAVVKDIHAIGEFKKKKMVTIAPSKDETVVIPLDCVFVIGGGSPAIKVE